MLDDSGPTYLEKNKVKFHFSEDHFTIEQYRRDETVIPYASISSFWTGGYAKTDTHVYASMIITPHSGVPFVFKFREKVSPGIVDEISNSNKLDEVIMDIKLCLFHSDFREERVTNEKDFIVEMDVTPLEGICR